MSKNTRNEISASEKRSLLDESMAQNPGTFADNTNFNGNSDQSCMVSSRKMKTTEIYDKLMGKERPIAIFFYGLFLILCPLVFRYSVYSSIKQTIVKSKYAPLGNSSLTMETDWASTQCLGYPNGVTLSSIIIKTFNVTDPDIKAGFPSIAIFASQDFKHW